MAGMAQVGITDPNLAMQIVQLLSPPGQNPFAGGGGAFGARPQAPVVSPGEYLVTITVNGKTLKQRLMVERASGTGATGLPF
jgi:hypothetical protein